MNMIPFPEKTSVYSSHHILKNKIIVPTRTYVLINGIRYEQLCIKFTTWKYVADYICF